MILRTIDNKMSKRKQNRNTTGQKDNRIMWASRAHGMTQDRTERQQNRIATCHDIGEITEDRTLRQQDIKKIGQKDNRIQRQQEEKQQHRKTTAQEEKQQHRKTTAQEELAQEDDNCKCFHFVTEIDLI